MIWSRFYLIDLFLFKLSNTIVILNYIFKNQSYQCNLSMKLPFFDRNFSTVLYDALFANDIWQNSHAYFIDIDLITQRSWLSIKWNFQQLIFFKALTFKVIIIPIEIKKTYNKVTFVFDCFIVPFQLNISNIFDMMH